MTRVRREVACYSRRADDATDNKLTRSFRYRSSFQ